MRRGWEKVRNTDSFCSLALLNSKRRHATPDHDIEVKSSPNKSPLSNLRRYERLSMVKRRNCGCDWWWLGCKSGICTNRKKIALCLCGNVCVQFFFILSLLLPSQPQLTTSSRWRPVPKSKSCPGMSTEAINHLLLQGQYFPCRSWALPCRQGSASKQVALSAAIPTLVSPWST